MTDKRRQNAEAYLKWLIDFHIGTTAIPAMAAGVTVGGQVAATAVSGVRRKGHSSRSRISDRFPIGSVTKPLTGFLFARIADQTELHFGSSLRQMHPDAIEALERPLASVAGVELPNPCKAWASHYAMTTVTDLMTHTSGLAYSPLGDSAREERELAEIDVPYGSTPFKHLRRKRKRYTQLAVTDEPFTVGEWTTPGPGLKPSCYSGGCIIVASGLEQRLGKNWETLMSEWIFQPLGVENPSFGELSEKSSITDTWMHQDTGANIVSKHDLRASQVSWTHAPAGAMALTMEDFGRILGAISVQHSGLMSPAGWHAYLDVPHDVNATTRGGWVRNGDALWHNGNYSGWYHSDAWIDLHKQVAYYACTNLGNENAQQACGRLGSHLRHLALAYDLFAHTDQAIAPARLRVSTDSTRSPIEGEHFDPLFMFDAWLSTRWLSSQGHPTITIEFDEPTEVSGIVLYQDKADSISEVEFILPERPKLRPTTPTLGRETLPPLQLKTHIRSSNGHVLHARLPSRRTLDKLEFKVKDGAGIPRINRLLVLR